MDMLSGNGSASEARLKYLDADFDVVKPGQYVVCAVTQRKIPLEDLRYWSVDDQEAYFDAEAATVAWKRKHGMEDAQG